MQTTAQYGRGARILHFRTALRCHLPLIEGPWCCLVRRLMLPWEHTKTKGDAEPVVESLHANQVVLLQRRPTQHCSYTKQALCRGLFSISSGMGNQKRQEGEKHYPKPFVTSRELNFFFWKSKWYTKKVISLFHREPTFIYSSCL